MTSPAELELTDDRLLGGRLRFLQPRRGYRVAIDPVLLAAAVPAAPGERVLDAGAAPARRPCASPRACPGARVVGLERDRELLAHRPPQRRRQRARWRPVELVAGDLLAPAARSAGRSTR